MGKRGKFIVFEGIDGSGKSTQIKLLKTKLEESGIKCVDTLEPTFGMVGGVLHDILSGAKSADPKVVAALFVADRLDHLTNSENGILKWLDEGYTVLCDRYYFSSYAYQSVEVPASWVVEANRLCADTLRPDCTIFIDVTPQEAMKRIMANRTNVELYEKEDRLTAVRAGYFSAFERLKAEENIKIFDGGKTPEEIAQNIQKYVMEEVFLCK